MPNHVTNTIMASAEVIAYLRTDVQIVDFSAVIPIPEDDDPIFTAKKAEFRGKDDEMISVGWCAGGYAPMDWAREHWGTKWNAYEPSRSDVEVYGGASQVTYYFDTAWSPPTPVIKKLGELFPTLDIYMHYQEEGMMFEGELQISGGEVISENEWETDEPEEEGEDY